MQETQAAKGDNDTLVWQSSFVRRNRGFSILLYKLEGQFINLQQEVEPQGTGYLGSQQKKVTTKAPRPGIRFGMNLSWGCTSCQVRLQAGDSPSLHSSCIHHGRCREPSLGPLGGSGVVTEQIFAIRLVQSEDSINVSNYSFLMNKSLPCFFMAIPMDKGPRWPGIIILLFICIDRP